MKFSFKKFDIVQEASAMKVGTDSVLLGCLADCIGAKQILDIGSGTGLLSLMMAQRTAARIDAVELDDAAYQETLLNVSASNWSDRIQVFHTSIQDFKPTAQYDLIITNPPYFPEGHQYQIAAQQRKNARHGVTLSFEDLMAQFNRLLTDDGVCWMILPLQEGEQFRTLVEDAGLFCFHEIRIQPRADKSVNRIILAFSKVKKNLTVDSFKIYDAHGVATQAYIDTTRDFYLWKQLDDDDRLKI